MRTGAIILWAILAISAGAFSRAVWDSRHPKQGEPRVEIITARGVFTK